MIYWIIYFVGGAISFGAFTAFPPRKEASELDLFVYILLTVFWPLTWLAVLGELIVQRLK